MPTTSRLIYLSTFLLSFYLSPSFLTFPSLLSPLLPLFSLISALFACAVTATHSAYVPHHTHTHTPHTHTLCVDDHSQTTCRMHRMRTYHTHPCSHTCPQNDMTQTALSLFFHSFTLSLSLSLSMSPLSPPTSPPIHTLSLYLGKAPAVTALEFFEEQLLLCYTVRPPL